MTTWLLLTTFNLLTTYTIPPRAGARPACACSRTRVVTFYLPTDSCTGSDLPLRTLNVLAPAGVGTPRGRRLTVQRLLLTVQEQALQQQHSLCLLDVLAPAGVGAPWGGGGGTEGVWDVPGLGFHPRWVHLRDAHELLPQRGAAL